MLKISRQGTVRALVEAVELDNEELSIKQQCEILGIHGSAYYYNPSTSDENRGYGYYLY
jgi:hypothetical protein